MERTGFLFQSVPVLPETAELCSTLFQFVQPNNQIEVSTAGFGTNNPFLGLDEEQFIFLFRLEIAREQTVDTHPPGRGIPEQLGHFGTVRTDGTIWNSLKQFGTARDSRNNLEQSSAVPGKNGTDWNKNPVCSERRARLLGAWLNFVSV